MSQKTPSELGEETAEEQHARFAANRELRLRVAASDWAKQFGWYVESDGQRRAELSDPQYDEMFWDSYAYTPLTDTPQERDQLDTPEFWKRDDLIYRSREFDLVATNAFAAGIGPQSGRISVRGLYLSPPLSLYDRFLLRIRRFQSRDRRA